MKPESVFDSDLQTSFDNADIVAGLMRIEKQLNLIAITMAFACGILMYTAVKNGR